MNILTITVHKKFIKPIRIVTGIAIVGPIIGLTRGMLPAFSSMLIIALFFTMPAALYFLLAGVLLLSMAEALGNKLAANMMRVFVAPAIRNAIILALLGLPASPFYAPALVNAVKEFLIGTIGINSGNSLLLLMGVVVLVSLVSSLIHTIIVSSKNQERSKTQQLKSAGNAGFNAGLAAADFVSGADIYGTGYSQKSYKDCREILSRAKGNVLEPQYADRSEDRGRVFLPSGL